MLLRPIDDSSISVASSIRFVFDVSVSAIYVSMGLMAIL